MPLLALKPMRPFNSAYPFILRYSDGVGLEEKLLRAEDSTAKKNFPSEPNN